MGNSFCNYQKAENFVMQKRKVEGRSNSFCFEMTSNENNSMNWLKNQDQGEGECLQEKKLNLLQLSKESFSSSYEGKLLDWQLMIFEIKEEDLQRKRLEDDLKEISFINSLIDQKLFQVFEKKKAKISKKIQEGPPMKFRWSSWKLLIYSVSSENEIIYDESLYNHLIKRKNSGEDYNIGKDLSRTFPEKGYFKGKGSPGHEILKRVLRAVSNYFPEIGYVQGMNFILGFLILVSQGSEMDTFFSFVNLACNQNYLLKGLFEKDLPLLQFLEFVTEKILAKFLPEFSQFLNHNQVPTTFLINKWFMTIFLYNMPFEICTRLWDNFIAKGTFALCSISVALIELFQEDILLLESNLEILYFLQEIQKQHPKIKNNLKKIINQSDSYLPKPKEIANYAKIFLKKNPNNTYAQAYSFYHQNDKFILKVQNINQRNENSKWLDRCSISSQISNNPTNLSQNNENYEINENYFDNTKNFENKQELDNSDKENINNNLQFPFNSNQNTEFQFQMIVM